MIRTDAPEPPAIFIGRAISSAQAATEQAAPH